jgi:predicted RNA binding protein YcfA (HicA-like mRNA interferase family)
MGRLQPVSWREMVRRFRALGFEGPLQRGKHPYMIRGDVRLTIPNIHRSEVGVDLLARMLRQAGTSRQDWERTEP